MRSMRTACVVAVVTLVVGAESIAFAEEPAQADEAVPQPPPPPAAPAAPSKAIEDAASERATAMMDDSLAAQLAALNGFRVPDNPTLDLLGTPDLDVTRPGSVSDLGTDLRALYKDGKIVPQIAVEFSPYALTLGRRTTYKDYLDHGYIRALQRFTLSVATTATGEGDGQATLGAVGARIRLIDDSDWRLDTTAVDCALKAAPDPRTPPPFNEGAVVVMAQDPTDDVVAKKAAEQRAAVAKCFEQPRSWNSAQLAIGGAISSAFPGGELRWDINDIVGWASYATGVGVATSLVISGKYLFNDVQRKGEVLQRARHTGALGFELEHRGEKYGVLLTAAFGSRWADDAMTSSWNREWLGLFGAEAQLRVGKGTWLSMSFSGEIVEGDGDQLVSLANFKWNYDLGAKKGD